MEWISYRIKTLSSLIVSPRSALAFYKELEEFRLKDIKSDSKCSSSEIKVIYPFYQYGKYTSYNPENSEYYIPGSSIKGALCQGSKVAGSFMVDDVEVPNHYIVLRNICKAQYLDDSETAACFKTFFDNLGFEMVKDNAELTGEFSLDSFKTASDLLAAANQSTRRRIGQMKEYLCELNRRDSPLEELKQAERELSRLLDDKGSCLLGLLGGYKGLLHSIELEEGLERPNSAVFLDPETYLPHGLVQMKLQ